MSEKHIQNPMTITDFAYNLTHGTRLSFFDSKKLLEDFMDKCSLPRTPDLSRILKLAAETLKAWGTVEQLDPQHDWISDDFKPVHEAMLELSIEDIQLLEAVLKE